MVVTYFDFADDIALCQNISNSFKNSYNKWIRQWGGMTIAGKMKYVGKL